jgi:hypothetical protein
MRFIFRKLEKEHTLAILDWRYTSPYDYYNFDAHTIQEDLRYLLDLKNAFCAILNVPAYQIRLRLRTKPGITSPQSIEVGDSNTSVPCPGR